MPRRTRAAVAATLSMGVLITGCSQARGGAEGFVSGSGTLSMVAVDERQEAPPIAGETLTGDPIALSDFAGQVVVLNVWGSWCGPCRSEAPELAAAAERLEHAQFVGVNVRDHGQQERALAFVRAYDLPYPSIYDPNGSTLLGLRPRATSIPSTVVIDADGRVAATVLGEVTESTLVGLVHDVQDGG
ncbi:MAG TPA: TlpA disulfide reductase family protein [Nocardioidaceae bacterium]|nr:TlpA disulfide reductase family protein [Nocardioidaceae bacterium]